MPPPSPSELPIGVERQPTRPARERNDVPASRSRQCPSHTPARAPACALEAKPIYPLKYSDGNSLPAAPERTLRFPPARRSTRGRVQKVAVAVLKPTIGGGGPRLPVHASTAADRRRVGRRRVGQDVRGREPGDRGDARRRSPRATARTSTARSRRRAGRSTRGRGRAMRRPSAARLIWQLADLIEQHADEFAELEALDNGKPVDRRARRPTCRSRSTVPLQRGLGDQDRGRDDPGLRARRLFLPTRCASRSAWSGRSSPGTSRC